MDVFIQFSNLVFRVRVPYRANMDDALQRFVPEQTPSRWDAEIEFIQGCQQLDRRAERCLGGDELMEFHAQGDRILCAARGGPAGPLAYTLCDDGASRLVCYINTEQYPPLENLSGLLQLVPLKWFLARRGVLLFHAAQIVTGGAGILFTAPSGTGKTTQSRLWNRCRDAKLVCNDRVLVQGLRTSGFPYDGGDPVCCPDRHELSAIVCLGQAPQNTITRLRPSRAVARLIRTVLFEAWDPAARAFVSDALLRIAAEVPVYELDCTPDEDAVRCLEEQLKKDGVIQ